MSSSTSQQLRVAFAGKKGHGKSTAAKLLAEGDDTCIISFAAPLKRICNDLYGIPDGAEKEVIVPHLGVTPRQIYQVFGTDAIRDTMFKQLPQLKLTNPWVYKAEQAIIARGQSTKPILIDDCRFEDEVKMLRKHGFTIVQIVRFDANKSEDKHASEMGCDCDALVVNNGQSTSQLDKDIREVLMGHSN